jgi:diaminopropionate ammonia-lyase
METPFFINKPSNKIQDSITTGILKNSDAISFHQSLSFYKTTPLVNLSELANKVGVGNIYVKDESNRFELNAFKVLGASYAMDQIIRKQKTTKIFCTATDGNHGRAVAWSAKLNNKNAIVCVPEKTSLFRIKAIENEGAKVIIVKGNYDQTCQYAKEISESQNLQLIQDTSWENYEKIPAQIMAGYLTHFVELENSLHTFKKPAFDIVFLQAGVGSWAASAVWYYLNRYKKKDFKIVLVEPSASDGLLESLKNRNLTIPKGSLRTIMAGLNCGIPSLSAWKILKNGIDASMRIEDKFAMQAMRILYKPVGRDEKIIAGESGAAGVGGFLAIMNDNRFKTLKQFLKISKKSNLLFFNTEGATDPENFISIVENNHD